MTYTDIFLFLSGLGFAIKFSLGGEIFVPDILLVLAIPFFFQNVHLIKFRGAAGALFLAGGLWLLSQMITDAYRGSPFEDWSRGWAKIVFFLLNFFSLTLIAKSRTSRLVPFLAGSASSLILQSIFFPTEYQGGGANFNDGAWKFGLAPGLTTLAAIFGSSGLAVRLFGIWGESLPLLIMGVMNLAFNYRSMFGMAIAAVAFGFVKRGIDSSPQLKRRITPAVFVVLLGGGVIFSQGLMEVYATAAEDGWLGIAAKEKYEHQTSGDLNLLQSGRVESLVSTRAIADSPIIGHGSWAKDVAYVAMLKDILESRGIDVGSFVIDENAIIPTHSHLLGSWVEAGILGGAFWMVVVVIILTALYRILKDNIAYPIFIPFVLFQALWDIFFSYFGATQRFIIPLRIVLAIAVITQSQRLKL